MREGGWEEWWEGGKGGRGGGRNDEGRRAREGYVCRREGGICDSSSTEGERGGGRGQACR